METELKRITFETCQVKKSKSLYLIEITEFKLILKKLKKREYIKELRKKLEELNLMKEDIDDFVNQRNAI